MSDSVRRPGRRTTAVGVVAVAAALVCAVAALAIADRPAGGDETATVTIAVSPSTVSPRTVEGPPATTTSSPVPTPGPVRTTAVPATSAPTTTRAEATTTTSTTLAISPLSSLVGEVQSALPPPPPVDVAPLAVTIDAIGVGGAPVRSVGVEPDGQLEIPGADEVGWYRLGAAPGQPGATVLAAHVSWQGRSGPFLRLADVEPGAFVDVALADGTTRRYQVVQRAQYGKLMLPREEIWRTTGPETLVLITCGGAFNPDIRRYADNIVVTAVPVGEGPTG